MYAEFVERSDAEQALCLHSSSDHNLLIVENTQFIHNRAQYAGSAVYLNKKQSKASCSVGFIKFKNCTFKQNSVIKSGYGGTTLHNITFPISGYKHHGVPQFKTKLIDCDLKENSASSQYPSGNGVIFTKADSYFKLVNTSISNNNSTGLLALNSNVILSGNITIKHNQGYSGGGLLLCQNSMLYFHPHTTVYIAYNLVKHKGGGIYVETECSQSQPMCFFQLKEGINYSEVHSIHVSVSDNWALFGGHNLFGGLVDNCFLLKSPFHKQPANQSIDIYRSIFQIPNTTRSSVSSPAQKVCLCENDLINCDIYTTPFGIFKQYPGETFIVNAILVGQLNGVVPGTVQASLLVRNCVSSLALGMNEDVQKVDSNSSCRELQYTIYTNCPSVILQLGTQHSSNKQLNISVMMLECPAGFTLVKNSTMKSCKCVSVLEEKKVNCEISTQTIKRIHPSWIGYLKSTNTTLYYFHCPFGYCTDKDVYINATDDTLHQDEQCAYKRTGVLCGACPRGLSVLFGSSKCDSCSNYWLLTLVVFAIVGFLIIVLLTVINLTITEGTLGGLLFYCNIVVSNSTTFFPKENATFLTHFLRTFVSLLSFKMNGIPLCLYSGMDGYAVAWLSFVFPLYIWLISGILVYFGSKVKLLVTRNSVQVLATLIILSYATLLHSVIEALQPAHILGENQRDEYVWLMDGNVRYFKGKHVPLVIFASLFGLFLLPFTVCLLFIQWLLKASHYGIFSWVNHLMPFFDAYTGPFTSAGRFWTGLLLLARITIFVVSAANLQDDQVLNLITISVTTSLLLLIALILPSTLYKRHYQNILEYSLLVNLTILSMFTAYLKVIQNGQIETATTHICVGISFITFTTVVLYHCRILKLALRIMSRVWFYVIKKCSGTKHHKDESINDQIQLHSQFPPFVRFDACREPLID